jgi:uncharacterized protein YvpB
VFRRRRVAALLLLVLLVAGGVGAAARGRGAPRVASELQLVLGGRTARSLALRGRGGDASTGGELAAAAARVLPETVILRRGPAVIIARVEPPSAMTLTRAAGAGRLTVRSTPVSAWIPAPLVGQLVRNDCESAALEVLLATLGVNTDQLALQRRLPINGPLDPVGPAGEQEWGDPDLGYVGRADGAGPSGGFGVYPRPIVRVAGDLGVRLQDLTGARPEQVYARVLSGRAVMVWVGLGDGPYGSWTSPGGRPVRVNFNEHTVVLTGIRPDGSLDLVNVLNGTRERWSRPLFERRFALLGRRAVAAWPQQPVPGS